MSHLWFPEVNRYDYMGYPVLLRFTNGSLWSTGTVITSEPAHLGEPVWTHEINTL